jgi:hypothetical protein
VTRQLNHPKMGEREKISDQVDSLKKELGDRYVKWRWDKVRMMMGVMMMMMIRRRGGVGGLGGVGVVWMMVGGCDDDDDDDDDVDTDADIPLPPYGML